MRVVTPAHAAYGDGPGFDDSNNSSGTATTADSNNKGVFGVWQLLPGTARGLFMRVIIVM